MKAINARSVGLVGLLGSVALLGGCVATGPVGYDYPYEYGAPHVDVDVYSPGYHSYPAYPYYDGRAGYDRRWYGRERPVPVPVPRAVPVPVPVPVPSGRGPGRMQPQPPAAGIPRGPAAHPGPGRHPQAAPVFPAAPRITTRPSDNNREQP